MEQPKDPGLVSSDPVTRGLLARAEAINSSIGESTVLGSTALTGYQETPPGPDKGGNIGETAQGSTPIAFDRLA